MIPIILLKLLLSLNGDPLGHHWIKVVSAETNEVVKEGATTEGGTIEWEFEEKSDKENLVVIAGIATEDYIGLAVKEVPADAEEFNLDEETSDYIPITFVFESQEIGELSWFGVDIISIKGIPEKYYKHFDRRHMFELSNVIAEDDTVVVHFKPGVYQFRGAPALIMTTPLSDPKPNYQIVSLQNTSTGETLEDIGNHKFIFEVFEPTTYFAKSELRPGEKKQKKKCRLFKKKSKTEQR